MKCPKSGGAWAIKWIYLNYVLTLNNKLSFPAQTPVVLKDFNAMQWIHYYQLARMITYHIRVLRNAPIPLHICRRHRYSTESEKTSFLAILWAPPRREGCLCKILCLLFSHQDRAASLMSNQPCTSRPPGKVHKARIDSTAYSLFPFETFIFNVTPTIMHSHLLSFVTNARGLHHAMLPSLEKCHPRGLFPRLCALQLERSLRAAWSLWPCHIQPEPEAPVSAQMQGNVLLLPGRLVDQCPGGHSGLVYFWGAILFHAGASERTVRLGGRWGADAFILPVFSFSGSPIGESGSSSPFLCPSLIWNHP